MIFIVVLILLFVFGRIIKVSVKNNVLTTNPLNNLTNQIPCKSIQKPKTTSINLFFFGHWLPLTCHLGSQFSLEIPPLMWKKDQTMFHLCLFVLVQEVISILLLKLGFCHMKTKKDKIRKHFLILIVEILKLGD